MKKLGRYLVLMVVLAGLLAGCGVTPEPTEVPPTQTPWIIVVTSTPGPEELAEVQPTQTPWIIIATPTRSREATPRPTKQAAASATPESTEEAALTLTPTPTPTGTEAEPTSTKPPSRPTETPEAGSLKYPPPVLLEPRDGERVDWRAQVTLIWDGVGPLAVDEYYHVHLERPPETEREEWYGDYQYTKDTMIVLEHSFMASFHPPVGHGNAAVYWWVRVVRKTGEDENGKPLGVDISEPSERRILVVEPKTGE